jgi:plasmid recombination enzyme
VPVKFISILKCLAGRGIKAPNEDGEIPKYRTVVNFIFGGNRERMLEITFGNQKVDLIQGADNSRIKRGPDIER